MLTLIRAILSVILLTLDKIFAPKILVPRTSNEKSALAPALAQLKIYQFEGCPFCIKVRRELRRLDLDIELRDAQKDPKWRDELVTQGGELQVPCLRIQDGPNTRWLYESSDINQYLRERFQ